MHLRDITSISVQRSFKLIQFTPPLEEKNYLKTHLFILVDPKLLMVDPSDRTQSYWPEMTAHKSAISDFSIFSCLIPPLGESGKKNGVKLISSLQSLGINKGVLNAFFRAKKCPVMPLGLIATELIETMCFKSVLTTPQNKSNPVHAVEKGSRIVLNPLVGSGVSLGLLLAVGTYTVRACSNKEQQLPRSGCKS